MRRTLIIIMTIILLIGIFMGFNTVYASKRAISTDMEGKIIELQTNSLKSIEDYKQKYGSTAYGITAYVLNQVRIYSVPFCFLGIAIGAIHQYMIGIRKLDTLEKGRTLITMFVTIFIICQILPLAFAVFVKFGRE